MRGLFIICFLILCELHSFGQIRTSEVDSLNSLLKAKKSVSLKKFGEARIELKDGTGYLRCTIVEVRNSYVVYMKRNTLHDQETSKIEVIKFEDTPWILQFNDQNIGQILFKNKN